MEYNRLGEQQISSVLFEDTVPAPEGYYPYYDYTVRIFGKIEQKMATTSKTSTRPMVYIELHDYKGRPSGLLLTEADYYLILTREYNHPYGWVVKARLFSVKHLKHLGEWAIEGNEKSFPINPFDEPHIWLGDFSVNEDGTWDISEPLRLNKYLDSSLGKYTRQVQQLVDQSEHFDV